MTASTVGVAQGASAEGFQVLDHRGLGGNGFNVCHTETPAIGSLVVYSGQNQVSLASGGVGATAQLAGFCDMVVKADMTGMRIDWHGEYALVDVDKVTVWNVGRFRTDQVSGTVADNALVYPAAGGKLSATQTGSDPAVGIARVGNNSVAGGAIEVEINLIGA